MISVKHCELIFDTSPMDDRSVHDTFGGEADLARLKHCAVSKANHTVRDFVL